MPQAQQFPTSRRKMKSSSVKKNVNQALSLNSRPITLRNLPKVKIRDFDGWFTATQGVSTVSNAVSEWKNLVPGGANLTQTTADRRPTLSTINNLSALVFDGDMGNKGVDSDKVAEPAGGEMMDGIGTGDFYIAFVIAASVGSGGGIQSLLSKVSSDLLPTSGFEVRYLRNSGRLTMTKTSGRSTVTLLQTADDMLVNQQTTLVEVHRLNGTLQIFKNGTSVASVSDSTDFTESGFVTIGNNSNNFAYAGAMGEFICKVGTVPVKTRQVIEALMATKWNIGAARTAKARGRAAGFNSLPATNKFRNRPPRF